MRAPLLLCLFALSSPVLAAEAGRPLALPDTPPGRQLGKWLEAFNTGRYDAIRAYFDANAGPADRERRAATTYGLALQTGGLALHAVERSTDEEVRALAQEKLTGLWVSLGLRVGKAPPHALAGIGIRPTAPPKEAAPAGPMTEADIVRELDALLRRMADADAFSGAVLVAKDDRPVFRKAYGLASKAYGVPNRPDTKFNLASMGKMFTGVAVVQLVQRGKLSLQDTVGKHLPDYPNKAVAEKVTIHQLLTHTGGLADMFNARYEDRKHRLRTVNDFLPLFAEDAPPFPPGERFRYSNAGYCLLGAIIEKASGQDYYDYLREYVFKPAGMANTDAYEMDRDTPNLAIGYTRQGLIKPEDIRARKNNLFLHVIKGSPAGGSFSTADDLFRFATALRNHKLLDADHTALVLTGKVDSGRPGTRYAYGFEEERVNGVRVVGHGGGFPGISSLLEMYTELGYTVVVLSNYDMVAQPVGFRLREMITQRAR